MREGSVRLCLPKLALNSRSCCFRLWSAGVEGALQQSCSSNYVQWLLMAKVVLRSPSFFLGAKWAHSPKSVYVWNLPLNLKCSVWQCSKRPLSADPEFTDMPKYVFADVYVTIEFIFSDDHFIFCQFFSSWLGLMRLFVTELGLELGASQCLAGLHPPSPLMLGSSRGEEQEPGASHFPLHFILMCQCFT